MDRRSFLRKATVGGATAAAASTLAAPLYAQNKRTLTMVTSWTRGLAGLHEAAERIATGISEATDGQLTIELKAAGELVGAFEVFDAVSSGQADLFHAADIYFVNQHPAYAFFTGIPFGMTAQEMFNWYYHDGGLALYDELGEIFGLKGFLAGNTGAQAGGWFKTEIAGPEDFAGLKFRMPGLGGQALGKLGASVQNVPGGEVYQALASGAIDGTEWIGPWADEKAGFQEITKIYYPAGFHEPAGGNTVTFNRDVYNSLTPGQQRLVAAVANETHVWNLSLFLSENSAALQRLAAAGVQLREFPDTVWNAFGAASAEVHEENMDDELYKKIYDSYMPSMRASSNWLTRSEGVYRSQRDRVLGG